MHDDRRMTDKPSGSWIVDRKSGVWTPADESTRERYGAKATYHDAVPAVHAVGAAETEKKEDTP